MKLVQKTKKYKPTFAVCHTCFIKYDMVKYGVSCPACKKKDKKN